MSQPPKSTMRAPSSRWRSNSGVFSGMGPPFRRLGGTALSQRKRGDRPPPVAPLSLDLRDQVRPARTAPLRWVRRRNAARTALQSSRDAAVVLPERFRAGCAFGAARTGYRVPGLAVSPDRSCREGGIIPPDPAARFSGEAAPKGSILGAGERAPRGTGEGATWQMHS